jgi:hypothetical protein
VFLDFLMKKELDTFLLAATPGSVFEEAWEW